MRPLPLLSLAGEYLDRVEHLADVRSGQVLTRATSAAPPPAAASEVGGAGLFCKTSNVRFETAEALRQHYHSDWYRLNLKRAGRGEPPVSEAGFEALADSGQLADEELSGSDSDGGELEGGLTGVQENEEGASSASAAAASDRRGDARLLLRDGDGRHMLAATICLPPTARSAAPNPAAARAQVWHAAIEAPSTRGEAGSEAPPPPPPLERLRLFCTRRPAPVWAVVLCRGGHFAAAVYTLPSSAASEESLKPLAHRCFHRYVTRRKAGGRQSVRCSRDADEIRPRSSRAMSVAVGARETAEVEPRGAREVPERCPRLGM